MAHAVSDEEGNARAPESCERSRESKSAGSALGGILLRKPESIDGKVSSAKAEKEQANEKPGKRCRPEIEDLPERQRDKHHHQCKEEGERSAATEPFSEPWHGETTQYGRKGNQHDAPGRQLRRL